MNKVIIIGNLVREPELRTLQDGTVVGAFTVAVNRKTQKSHPEADYFRVTAWRGLAEVCQKYLHKGKKVMVEGFVRAGAYIDKDGQARGTLELTASGIEFLSPAGGGSAASENEAAAGSGGEFVEVAEDSDMPF